MNKPELELLDIEALLETSAILAEELRRSGEVTLGATVDELCRRLMIAQGVFLSCQQCGSYAAALLHNFKDIREEFGVEL